MISLIFRVSYLTLLYFLKVIYIADSSIIEKRERERAKEKERVTLNAYHKVTRRLARLVSHTIYSISIIYTIYAISTVIPK